MSFWQNTNCDILPTIRLTFPQAMYTGRGEFLSGEADLLLLGEVVDCVRSAGA